MTSAAAAMATVIIEPENFSRTTVSFCLARGKACRMKLRPLRLAGRCHR
jgi:hypothetical protein